MRKGWRVTAGSIALVLVGGLALAACGNDDDDAVVGEEEINEVTVVASDHLSFEPDELEIQAGERVRIVLDNTDSHDLHDLVVDHISVEDVHEEGADDEMHGDHGDHGDHDLHVAADGGETGSVEFTATEAGEYEFYCSVAGHREGGMTGTLIVE